MKCETMRARPFCSRKHNKLYKLNPGTRRQFPILWMKIKDNSIIICQNPRTLVSFTYASLFEIKIKAKEGRHKLPRLLKCGQNNTRHSPNSLNIVPHESINAIFHLYTYNCINYPKLFQHSCHL